MDKISGGEIVSNPINASMVKLAMRVEMLNLGNDAIAIVIMENSTESATIVSNKIASQIIKLLGVGNRIEHGF